MIEQKLPLHYPARLSLKSGIKEIHLGLDVNDLQGVIYRFLSRLKALKVVVDGPLWVKSCGNVTTENDTVYMDYVFYVETTMATAFKSQFQQFEKFEVSPCVQVDYVGSVDTSHLAQSKMDVFSFERKLMESGDMYTAIHFDNGKYIKATYFRKIYVQ
ncbi:hypothetical protein [Erysipelothrix anatis]|uniref:hypothetical protein n=1 Tax=Erysipelothrix anatis TaxID=2683713 RepID=UPI00135A87B3|nr:hypothetical protein [Erysipelothrix anatis]